MNIAIKTYVYLDVLGRSKPNEQSKKKQIP